MNNDLRGGNGRRKHLTGGEFSRFLDATYDAPPEQRSLCFLLARTGCQVEEAIALIDRAGYRPCGGCRAFQGEEGSRAGRPGTA